MRSYFDSPDHQAIPSAAKITAWFRSLPADTPVVYDPRLRNLVEARILIYSSAGTVRLAPQSKEFPSGAEFLSGAVALKAPFPPGFPPFNRGEPLLFNPDLHVWKPALWVSAAHLADIVLNPEPLQVRAPTTEEHTAYSIADLRLQPFRVGAVLHPVRVVEIKGRLPFRHTLESGIGAGEHCELVVHPPYYVCALDSRLRVNGDGKLAVTTAAEFTDGKPNPLDGYIDTRNSHPRRGVPISYRDGVNLAEPVVLWTPLLAPDGGPPLVHATLYRQHPVKNREDINPEELVFSAVSAPEPPPRSFALSTSFGIKFGGVEGMVVERFGPPPGATAPTQDQVDTAVMVGVPGAEEQRRAATKQPPKSPAFQNIIIGMRGGKRGKYQRALATAAKLSAQRHGADGSGEFHKKVKEKEKKKDPQSQGWQKAKHKSEEPTVEFMN